MDLLKNIYNINENAANGEKSNTDDLTPEEVKELFNYDSKTGKLTWAVSRQKIQKGSEAGNLDEDGYMRTRINGVLHYNHVLIYMLVTGKKIPEDKEIDHINRIRHDNRLENLRLATKSENQKNKNSY
jgi:hypothetical protein